ncbi:hypothetical protein E2C01_050931 [Portunus trituberculatus]|uniref:Uncharacterized protein n=1 Tax=Portunus trituberculatus TaxID=210409 RepID=A0A5B7GHR3_PORTR|nr:hypothetical protein [Portunus trituberculatus]
MLLLLKSLALASRPEGGGQGPVAGGNTGECIRSRPLNRMESLIKKSVKIKDQWLMSWLVLEWIHLLPQMAS